MQTTIIPSTTNDTNDTNGIAARRYRTHEGRVALVREENRDFTIAYRSHRWKRFFSVLVDEGGNIEPLKALLDRLTRGLAQLELDNYAHGRGWEEMT